MSFPKSGGQPCAYCHEDVGHVAVPAEPQVSSSPVAAADRVGEQVVPLMRGDVGEGGLSEGHERDLGLHEQR